MRLPQAADGSEDGVTSKSKQRARQHGGSVVACAS
jgi:hypothetical protein